MNAQALAKLGQNAAAWSKCFVALKEALVREGVEPEEASQVARDATNLAALYHEGSDEACPLCGRGEE